MKLEGSIQEIKEFMKEFQSRDAIFTKQQLEQIKRLLVEKEEENKWKRKKEIFIVMEDI